MKFLTERSVRIVLLSFGAIVICLTSYLSFLQLSNNFHVVIEGELYRSAQLSEQEIKRYSEEYSIQAIINLRGDNRGKEWYDKEVQASDLKHIRHFNFRMSAKRVLSQEQAQDLIAMMREAPKPLLIHCQAGSDRTGLASALYMAAIKGQDEHSSESQLSIKYGHFSIPFISKAYPMYESWENLEPWLGFDKT